MPRNETSTWAWRVSEELRAADARASTLMSGLSWHQLNWKPRPDSWSIGQCIEHLCAANEVYLGAIAPSLAGRRAGAVEEIQPGWFGRWFLRNYIAPSERTRRGKAPRKIAPGSSAITADVLDRFLRSNDNARKFIAHASGYDVNRIRFRNPFVPLLRFTVGTGLEILWQHQARHLLQGERVRTLPEFPV